MKWFSIVLMTVFLFGCSPHREVVDIINGKDGTSCSVSNYELSSDSEEASVVLGAMISCTDGSSAVVFNGHDGANGLDGTDGLNGLDGLDGVAGASCYVSREANADHVTVTCGETSVTLYDGADGSSGGGASVQTIALTSSCTAVGASASAKKDGSSVNAKLYSTTDCTGTALNMGDGDSAWTPDGELVSKVQDAATLKLVTFN